MLICGSEFGATGHYDVHHAFMTLPAYTCTGGRRRSVWQLVGTMQVVISELSQSRRRREKIAMDELINLITEKTGIPPDVAKPAAEVVIGFLKQKLPAPVGS